MIAITSPAAALNAEKINKVTADEAYQLMTTALERFLNVVETLNGEDWPQPTYCSAWNVRDIMAHQAGGFAGGASLKEMLRQISHQPGPNQLPEDAINAFQLAERTDKTPQELIEEIRQTGPIAAKKWAYGLRLLRLVSIPHRDAGRLSLKHLNWVIHSRDTWMHRLDICHATGREFVQTPEHDGRIVELVMLDVAETLARKVNGPALIFELTGVAGGTWAVGQGVPAATIRMDALEFNLFASGRYTYEKARPKMTITGDISTAEAALKEILIVY